MLIPGARVTGTIRLVWYREVDPSASATYSLRVASVSKLDPARRALFQGPAEGESCSNAAEKATSPSAPSAAGGTI
jgi:hypothetical protein